MRASGVICEFNPFHNGHKYLIDTVKNSGDGENTITVVMSESFVQRGECACVSPYYRTRMALENGVDLVLSLPVAFATASAERFAQGGIGVLGALGCVDVLGFGSESGDVEVLQKCAEAITAEEFDDLELTATAFDEYEKIPEPRPESDVYVDGLIETVEEQIDSIKESLGIEPDAKVEITQDENGDTEIKADGEVVASENTEETAEEEGTEPTEEGKQGELDFDGDEEEEDDPEEIKKLEEELAKSL